jgi:hypothetical protein
MTSQVVKEYVLGFLEMWRDICDTLVMFGGHAGELALPQPIFLGELLLLCCNLCLRKCQLDIGGVQRRLQLRHLNVLAHLVALI